MTSRPHVVVVGDVGWDVVAALAGPIVPGEETRGGVVLAAGGAGGNAAAWLARSGIDVTLVGRVGDDESGRRAASVLTAAGVRCALAVDPVLPTCCVVVLVEPGGDRTMVSDRGANAALAEGDVALPQVAGRGHLHLSGYMLLDAGSRAAGLFALTSARAAGWTTSVDPQSATLLADADGGRFLRWCDPVDLMLPNDAELDALGGAAAVLDVARAVAVTHGPLGASWLTRSERIDVPAPAPHLTDRRGGPDPGPPTIDSTGAGDAFNAGLLAEWVRGAEPRDALFAGVAAGTAAASRVGARPDRAAESSRLEDQRGQASGTSPR